VSLGEHAPEDQTLAAWAKRFSCTCCQCWGACGVQKLGFNYLLTAISDASATGATLGRSWKQTWRQEAMGLRVRVKLTQGSLEGNVIHVEGPQVRVRVTLKCIEKGVKTRKSVTETVSVEQL